MTDEHGIDLSGYLKWRVADLLESNRALLVRVESLADDVQNLEELLGVAMGERESYRKKFYESENELIYYRSLVTNVPEKEKSLEQQIAFAFQAHAVDEYGAIMWLARVIDRMSNVSKGETK